MSLLNLFTRRVSLTTNDMYSFWTIALVWCDPEVICARRPERSRRTIAKRLKRESNPQIRLLACAALSAGPAGRAAASLEPSPSLPPSRPRSQIPRDVASHSRFRCFIELTYGRLDESRRFLPGHRAKAFCIPAATLGGRRSPGENATAPDGHVREVASSPPRRRFFVSFLLFTCDLTLFSPPRRLLAAACTGSIFPRVLIHAFAKGDYFCGVVFSRFFSRYIPGFPRCVFNTKVLHRKFLTGCSSLPRIIPDAQGKNMLRVNIKTRSAKCPYLDLVCMYSSWVDFGSVKKISATKTHPRARARMYATIALAENAHDIYVYVYGMLPLLQSARSLLSIVFGPRADTSLLWYSSFVFA